MSDKRAQKSRVLTLTNRPFLGIIRNEIEKVLWSTEKLKVLLLRCEPGRRCPPNTASFAELVVLHRNLTSLVFSLPLIGKSVKNILEEAKREAEMLPFLLFL